MSQPAENPREVTAEELAAQDDEHRAELEGLVNYHRGRAVALNLEIRHAQARVAQLEQRVRELETTTAEQ